MAKEYIEREALIEKLQEVEIGFRHCGVGIAPALASGVKGAIDKIKSFPTADVVEVVRCKDCVLRGTDDCAMYYICECGTQYSWETGNDFCSFGKRKDK